MQQALLGRGSNRKTAAGGLKEAVLERCACAPQNLEESGGDRNEGTVSREGHRPSTSKRRKSARDAQGETKAVDADEGAGGACSDAMQARNKSSQSGSSCIFNGCPGAVQTGREAATDSEKDSHGAEESKYPQAGVQSASSGGYEPGQEFDAAAGGLLPSGVFLSFVHQLKVCFDSGNIAAAAWTAEAQRSKTAGDMHAQRMTVASEAVSAMAAMLVAGGTVRNCADRSRLFEVNRAVAAMAAVSREEAAQTAQSSADTGRKATELAGTVSEALCMMAVDIESMASEIKGAVEIAVSRAKRQRTAAMQPDVEPSAGADEQEPAWLRSAKAELMATAPGCDGQDSRQSESPLVERTVAQLFAVCTLQQAWRGRVKRRLVGAAGAAAVAQLTLAHRQREARARLDVREAEEAARRQAAARKSLNRSSRRVQQRREAAVCIQAAWRGLQARDASRQRRGIRAQAALCIRAVQMRLTSTRRVTAAAARIQAVWRDFHSRTGYTTQLAIVASPLLITRDAGQARSGGRQRRAARLARQRDGMQQERTAYDWAAVQSARAEMAVAMGENWEERAHANLERSRLRYAEGLSRLASELAPPRRRRLGYATWS